MNYKFRYKNIGMQKLFLLYCLFGLSLAAFAQGNQRRLVSPEIQPDNSVIFRMKAPGAYSVQVVGTFSRAFRPTPMEKKDTRLQ